MIGLLLAAGISLNAQSKQVLQSANELYGIISRLDSLLFDAFNKRDTAVFNSYFSKDLEFYHDKGGLTGYAHTIGFLQSLIDNKSDLKRTLQKDKLEVYPVPGYGAVETGEHRFCHTENGRQDCGSFKFLHVWKYENGKWKITRAISYDH